MTIRPSSAHTTLALILVALAVATLTFACGGGDEADDGAAARQAQLEELRQDKQALDAERDELESMRERLAQAQSGELPEGEEVDTDQLQADIEQLDAQITEDAEALNAAIVEFINADPPIEGEPIPPATQEAFAIKANEDLTLAEEYITKGGDYARAIRIYEDVLAFDPDNADAQAAMEHAEQMRYMDQERFAQVEKGMNQAQVRELLGTVNRRNVRTYEEEGREAWFYPKGKNAGAAGVYFQQKNGGWQVYRADFDAVPPAGEGEDEDVG